ncbi:MAG: outer membrane protein assembly factor, partial [Muribaculaceae bacterium]|nr:outer membrane protein assembly factor [Muribaculaceae bacterium]
MKARNRRVLGWMVVAVMAMVFAACRTTKHVPDGEYLLDKVSVKVDGENPFSSEELTTYLRQLPNHKMLWLTKFRLGIYNLSGKDSTKWLNKRLRALGEAPVIFDTALTAAGVEQLTQAFVNKGYLSAEVTADTVVTGKKKMSVDYRIQPGEPHRIATISRKLPEGEIGEILGGDTVITAIEPGKLLDISLLEAERERITRKLRNEGFYTFNKELITFSADTTAGSLDVDLTMTVALPESKDSVRAKVERYIVRKVIYVTDYDGSGAPNLTPIDTVTYRDIEIFYRGKQYLRPSVLWENNFITPGEPYNEVNVQKTYNALSR